MSESAPPPVVESTDVRRTQILTPDAIEGVLADFRSWLYGASETDLAMPGGAAEPAETVSLYTLASQFVALRHEVHLQTRATRGQQAQNEEALQKLGRTLDSLEKTYEIVRRQGTQDREERIRGLLKTLVDVGDAL